MTPLPRSTAWLGAAGIALAYLASRALYLDADLPNWWVTYYAPLDEFYYNTVAFNLVEGAHAPDGEPVFSGYWFFNILQQLATAFTLLLFGDNYFGLRAASVLAGGVVVGSFHWLVGRRFGAGAAFAFSLVLICEFSFLLATRVAEPTIFRASRAGGGCCTTASGWPASASRTSWLSTPRRPTSSSRK